MSAEKGFNPKLMRSNWDGVFFCWCLRKLKKWSCGVMMSKRSWQWGYRWSWLNCIFHVGRRWWMNRRLKLLFFFGRSLMMRDWWFQAMLWKVEVFHLYLWIQNFLASSSWDCDLIYRSMIWWIYWSLTYPSKGEEIVCVLIGSLTFVFAILSADMLSFASIVSSDLGILEYWCPRIYWIENGVGMSWFISCSTSFSFFLVKTMMTEIVFKEPV